MNNDRYNRVLGSLVGHAVGDALGATVEFMSQQEIAETHGVHREMIGGGWLDLEPGQVTDDTEMMLCLAESLVDRNGIVDLKDMAERLRAWYEDDPVDVGHTVRAGLHRYCRTGELERPSGDQQAGNGALMRVLPMLLAEVGLELVAEHCHLTHHNSVSDSCVRMYAYHVRSATYGRKVARYSGVSGTSGYVLDSLSVVLHCFSATDTFEDALVQCVNLGGDADTNGAILGGLAGALYGFNAMPERWIKALDRRTYARLERAAQFIATH